MYRHPAIAYEVHLRCVGFGTLRWNARDIRAILRMHASGAELEEIAVSSIADIDPATDVLGFPRSGTRKSGDVAAVAVPRVRYVANGVIRPSVALVFRDLGDI